MRVCVRVFLPEFFFAWTLSCTSACLRVRVLVFLIEFSFCVDACVFAWTRACLRGRVRVFLPELFFAWTLSCTSVCLRVFLIEFFLAWTCAYLLSCSLSFFLL